MRTNYAGEPATVYPRHIAEALQLAAACHDCETIDRITDELAREGLARERSDASRFAPAHWAAPQRAEG